MSTHAYYFNFLDMTFLYFKFIVQENIFFPDKNLK